MAITSLILLLIVFPDAVTLLTAETSPSSSSAPAPALWTDSVGRKPGWHKFMVPRPSTSREEAVLCSFTSSSSVVDWNGEATVTTQSRSQASSPLHHKKVDRSVAGGGVILGGLGMTFLVAVFCYIRATRRHRAKTTDAPA